VTKVSRLPLRNDVWERIFELFIGTLADIKDKRKLRAFVGDFFTPTERIMFAKRLAASVLLAKGHDYTSIRRILKLSNTTIARMSAKVKYEGQGLQIVISDILKKQSATMIWKEIEGLFDLPTKATLRSPARAKRERARARDIERIAEEF